MTAQVEREYLTALGVEPVGGGRSPRLAQLLSAIPGLGQMYYGAAARGLQYLAATLGAGALLAVLFFNTGNLWLLLVQTGIHPLLRLLVLVLSELLELGLLISMISFWIAAWWDAKQGTLALNAARPHRPTWWFVKVKRFLFDDPDVEGSDV